MPNEKKCMLCGGDLRELWYMADANGNSTSAVLQDYGHIELSCLRLASCANCGLIYAVPADRLANTIRISSCDTSASSVE